MLNLCVNFLCLWAALQPINIFVRNKKLLYAKKNQERTWKFRFSQREIF